MRVAVASQRVGERFGGVGIDAGPGGQGVDGLGGDLGLRVAGGVGDEAEPVGRGQGGIAGECAQDVALLEAECERCARVGGVIDREAPVEPAGVVVYGRVGVAEQGRDGLAGGGVVAPCFVLGGEGKAHLRVVGLGAQQIVQVGGGQHVALAGAERGFDQGFVGKQQHHASCGERAEDHQRAQRHDTGPVSGGSGG